MQYPYVYGELHTVRTLLSTGKSIARFGDGEVKLMDGGAQVREERNEKLGNELHRVISTPNDQLLVGIPTMDPAGPKIQNWEGRKARTLKYLSPNVEYYSSFISRPDSAPWICTQEYANLVCDFWRGKNAVIVSEPTSKLLTLMRKTAGGLKHIECPSYGAYSRIDEFEDEIVRKGRGVDVVVLSCGPAASCLAARLAPHIQTIDLGSAGGMLLKLLDMEPLGDLRTVVLQRPKDMTVADMQAKLSSEWELRFFDEKER